MELKAGYHVMFWSDGGKGRGTVFPDNSIMSKSIGELERPPDLGCAGCREFLEKEAAKFGLIIKPNPSRFTAGCSFDLEAR